MRMGSHGPYGSALKTTIHGSCGLRTGSVRYLEILKGPARAVTTDYGRFACGCSQDHNGPYNLMIPKNTNNPQNALMHVTMHIEEG